MTRQDFTNFVSSLLESENHSIKKNFQIDFHIKQNLEAWEGYAHFLFIEHLVPFEDLLKLNDVVDIDYVCPCMMNGVFGIAILFYLKDVNRPKV